MNFRKLGINTTFVDSDDPDNFARAITPKTKLLYAETIGNPSMNVLDIEKVAAIATAHDLPLFIDNTFASPYLCRPFEWGAAIVMHSATKFLNGHSDMVGGIAVVGDNAELKDLTALRAHTHVGEGEIWDGSPAHRVAHVDLAGAFKPTMRETDGDVVAPIDAEALGFWLKAQPRQGKPKKR